ncbi:MAG: deoxyribonuclease V [Dehalococcoidia bacterium]
MNIKKLHPWDLTPAEAREVQRDLASRVERVSGLRGPPRYIAAADISGARRGEEALAAVVVLRYPELDLVEVRTARRRPAMPYVPGLLSFRETPVLLEAFEKLTVHPDLVMVDGHGLAHPRRFGIACHIGLLLDLPAIGCAKSVLVGRHGPLGTARGSCAELVHDGEVVGAAVRTRAAVTPVYASIGHKVDLTEAIEWTLACAPRFRLPEPARLAHQAASGLLSQASA